MYSAVWSLPAASFLAPVLGSDQTATRQHGCLCPLNRGNLTPDGLVPIEDIQIGDFVTAYDFATGALIERRVFETVQNSTDYWVLVTVGGDQIKATRTHRFWIESENNWLPTIELKPGMTMRLADGRIEKVAATQLIALTASERTFNLGVECNHNYFVGEICVLVHNGDSDKLSEEEIRRRAVERAKEIKNGEGTWVKADNKTLQPQTLQKQLQGTGQLDALRSNPNLKGVNIENVLTKTPEELQNMVKNGELSKDQLKTINKAFEGRELRTGGGRKC